MEQPLLRVEVCGVEVGRVEEAPSEHDFVAQVTSGAPAIHFIKSDGSRIIHDLSNFGAEPETSQIQWLHLCVVLHGAPQFGVQADCILAFSDEESSAYAADPDRTIYEYNEGNIPGVRIQPFFLPERTEPPPPPPLNSFERGLSYSDAVTPTRTSVSCICDECGLSFRLQPHYAGDKYSFVYCSKGIHALSCSRWEDGSPMLCTDDPDPVDEETCELERLAIDHFDQALPSCSHCQKDGTNTGRYSFFETDHVFRCPHCAAPFLFMPEGRRKESYWFELHAGPVAQPWSLTAVHPLHWEPPPPGWPPAAKS